MPITRNNIPKFRKLLTGKGGPTSAGVEAAVDFIAFQYHKEVTEQQAQIIDGEYVGSQAGEYPNYFSGQSAGLGDPNILGALNPSDPTHGRAGVKGRGKILTWLAGEEPGGASSPNVSSGDGEGSRGRRKGLLDVWKENQSQIKEAFRSAAAAARNQS